MFSFFLLVPLLGISVLIIFTIGAFADYYNYKYMNNSAKYVFYYLLSLVALAFTAVSVGMIAFGIINETMTSPLSSSYDPSSSFRFAISALAIAAPIFFVIQSLIFKGLRKGDLPLESPVRRWMTYLILFVSAVTILGVLIAVLNNFLSGDFTLRFILQMLTVLFLAGIIFSFYLLEIRRADAKEGLLTIKIFFFSSLLLVIVAFVSAWFFMESPTLTRAKKLDSKLINSINLVENSINSYYQEFDKLPEDLSVLKNSRTAYFSPQDLVDADTGLPLVYEIIDEGNYKLCATFRTDTDNTEIYRQNHVFYGQPHGAGYHCFDLKVWELKSPATTEEKR
ncbi:hypothetical protein EOL72_01575 [Candidatus Falkowbacteria bacterium]|nr:hypothetical protein [Candidatus Falkowbacteria bacterium]